MQNTKLSGKSSRKFDLQRIVVFAVVLVLIAVFSLFSRDFLTKGIPDISATDTPGDMLVEVKYDAFLPEVIQDIIQTPGIRQQAFSKYGACRRYG